MKTRIVVLLMMAVSNLTAQVIQTISQTQTSTTAHGGSATVSLSVQDTEILASGSATGGVIPGGDPSGESTASVTFNLTRAYFYSLSGQLSKDNNLVGATTSVNLSGPSGTVFAAAWVNSQGTTNYSTSGALEAGVYTLRGNAQAHAPGGWGTASYTVDFKVTKGPDIIGVSVQGDNACVTWKGRGGTNVVQATASALNDFVDISDPIIIPGFAIGTTNYIDVGGATNSTRFYRLRMVP